LFYFLAFSRQPEFFIRCCVLLVTLTVLGSFTGAVHAASLPLPSTMTLNGTNGVKTIVDRYVLLANLSNYKALDNPSFSGIAGLVDATDQQIHDWLYAIKPTGSEMPADFEAVEKTIITARSLHAKWVAEDAAEAALAAIVVLDDAGTQILVLTFGHINKKFHMQRKQKPFHPAKSQTEKSLKLRAERELMQKDHARSNSCSWTRQGSPLPWSIWRYGLIPDARYGKTSIVDAIRPDGTCVPIMFSGGVQRAHLCHRLGRAAKGELGNPAGSQQRSFYGFLCARHWNNES
jgi:hypothetical protein